MTVVAPDRAAPDGPPRAAAAAVVPARERRAPARTGQWAADRPDVGPPRWPRPAHLDGGVADGGRPADGLVRHVPDPDRADADGPQPVARPALRYGSAGRGASLDRLRRRLAARRPRDHDDRGLRPRRRARRARRSVDPGHHLSVRPVGRGRDGPVRGGRHQLDARGAPAGVVRDLARDPPVRLPGGRPDLRPSARGRRGFPGRPGRPAVLERAVRLDRGDPPRLPFRPADPRSRCATACASRTSSAKDPAWYRST